MSEDDDAAAYEAFVRGQGSSLLRYAVLISDDFAAAEDATQECLIRVAKHWRRANRDNIHAYARRTLTNIVIDQSRRKVVRDRTAARLAVAEPEVSHEQALVDRLTVQQLLLDLPVRQRVMVVMRYWDGSSERDIADALGCSVGNVKSQSHSALRRLRAALAASERET